MLWSEAGLDLMVADLLEGRVQKQLKWDGLERKLGPGHSTQFSNAVFALLSIYHTPQVGF